MPRRTTGNSPFPKWEAVRIGSATISLPISALHSFFVAKRRPLPRFIFLDQPTQVFYPPELDKDGKLESIPNDDRQAVHRMFRWVAARIEELSPDLQVIVMDHADIDEPYFQEAIVERWRGDLKLIPASWL